MSKSRNRSSLAILRPLIKTYTRPYLKDISVALFFMILAAASTAGFAQLLQPILDKALIGVQRHPETVHVIVPLGLSILACFVVRGFSTYYHVVRMNKVSQSIVADIQSAVFAHFLSLDLKFFHSNPSGQLVSRVTNDVNVLRAAVSESLTGLGNNLLTLLGLVGVMFWQDWKLACITFTAFPFASGLVVYLGRRLRKVSKSIQGQTAHLMGVLSQIFQGIRQVQAYGMEDAEREKGKAAVWSVRHLNMKAARISNLATPVNETLVGLVTFGIIVYGGYEIAGGHLTPGKLISFIAAFGLAYEPMKKLSKLNTTLQMGVGAAERVLEMMDLSSTIVEAHDAANADFVQPQIEFANVSFRYDLDSNEKALNGISFTAQPGKVTALVGPSGSGKSTILNLILRFYDCDSGEIKLGGYNIAGLTLKSLRKNIALVSQDITIFNDTLAANISYGTQGASEEDIRKAARAAAAEDFILNMPEGFDTIVGENGVRLSGGQRQRIALARAILRNAPILLLDEATSALDNESERLIQETLKELEKDRTTIVIAHRLSTIQNADQILVLDKGVIAEQGRHAELLATNGVYARMYNSAIVNESET